MKNQDDDRLLARKRQFDEARRVKAIDRAHQSFLRATTPGVATPGTIKMQMDKQRMDKALQPSKKQKG